ncbi:MMPL family transporter [Ornithinicoccus halotolerans]|uniref:MMPL family transporter n=1 Tax=Ornithinicoccus halotolerans TaxID=1748220 RepID=UPI00129678E1|nr:MMPL family transporter [Ornithinicoccus halotolerans]
MTRTGSVAGPPQPGRHRTGHGTGRRRRAWAVTLLGLLVGLGVLLGVGPAERSPATTDDLAAGYDSTRAEVLRERLPQDDDEAPAVVLFTADGDIPEQLPQLEQLLGQLPAGQQLVTGAGPALTPAEDGTAATAVVQVPTETATQAQAEVAGLRQVLREGAPDGVTAQVTGPAAIEADLAAVFEGANTTLLAVTAAVVAVLLLVTYRSPVLWLLPLAVVALADRVAVVLATQVLALAGVPWDESTEGILSVLVFGAGTNYALLLVSRYRDELRLRDDRHAAVAVARRRTAEAVLASAATVVIGVLVLLFSVFPTTRGLGLACAVGVTVAAAAVLLVLPSVLVLPGRWVFWPRVPRVGQQVLSEGRTGWRRVGDLVARRAPVMVAVTVAVLLAAGAGSTQVRLGLSPSEQFLQEPEAITAGQRLAQSFPAGLADPVVVVSETEDPTAVADLTERLGQVAGVVTVSPAGQGGGVTELRLLHDEPAGTEQAAQLVARVRQALQEAPDGERTAWHVTGTSAQALDSREGAERDRWLLVPAILVLVLLALAGILRSVLAPALLVASVVLSYTAALGVSWWLFTGPLGFSALDESVPLLSFLFLVALGVDYNIFLITRTLEEAPASGTREGVLRALAATGGVITSAGILLAAVFAVLGVLPLVVLAQIGTVICLGVLLDTLVVRTVLVPAVVHSLGEPFWWPRRVARSAG